MGLHNQPTGEFVFKSFEELREFDNVDELKRFIAFILISFRASYHQTQDAIAVHMGTTSGAIKKWESGAIKMSKGNQSRLRRLIHTFSASRRCKVTDLPDAKAHAPVQYDQLIDVYDIYIEGRYDIALDRADRVTKLNDITQAFAPDHDVWIRNDFFRAVIEHAKAVELTCEGERQLAYQRCLGLLDQCIDAKPKSTSLIYAIENERMMYKWRAALVLKRSNDSHYRIIGEELHEQCQKLIIMHPEYGAAHWNAALTASHLLEDPELAGQAYLGIKRCPHRDDPHRVTLSLIKKRVENNKYLHALSQMI